MPPWVRSGVGPILLLFHSLTSTSANQVDGPKLANMLQNGKTPLLPPKQLQEIGYTIVAYPLALLRWADSD